MPAQSKVLCLLVACTLLVSSASAVVVGRGDQCGGVGGLCSLPGYGPCVEGTWPGATCKEATDVCTKKNDFWWSCQEGTAQAPVPTTPTDVRTVGVDEQCGGYGGNCGSAMGNGPCVVGAWPGYSCEAGSVCVEESARMWYCAAGGVKRATPAPAAQIATRSSGATAVSDPSIISENRQCGGTGSDCGKKGLGACKAGPWDGFSCEVNTVCMALNDDFWFCNKVADAVSIDIARGPSVVTAAADKRAAPSGTTSGTTSKDQNARQVQNGAAELPESSGSSAESSNAQVHVAQGTSKAHLAPATLAGIVVGVVAVVAAAVVVGVVMHRRKSRHNVVATDNMTTYNNPIADHAV